MARVNLRDELRNFDPELRFLKEYDGSLEVCKVERAGKPYIFKAAFFDSFKMPHLKSEKMLLEEARDLPGITHIVKYYGGHGEFYGALLKEFFEGKDLSTLNVGLTQTRLQRKLEETVRAIHKLGYADLDLNYNNIVLSPDKSDVCIIDLGNARYVGFVNDSQADFLKSRDLEDIDAISRKEPISH